MFRESDFEAQELEIKEKKKLMQDKFLKKMNENKNRNFHKTTELKTRSESNNVDKEKYAKLEQTVDKKEKKIEELQIKVQDLQRKHLKSKEEKHSLKIEFSQTKQKLNECEKENLLLKDKIKKFEEQLEQLHNQQSSEELNKLKKELKHKTKLNGELNKKNEKLKRSNEELSRQIKINQTLAAEFKNDKLRKEINQLRKQLSFFQTKFIESELSIPEMVGKLEENLSIDTVELYTGVKNKLSLLSAEVSRLMKIKKSQKSAIDVQSDEKSALGYISKTKSGWRFFDLSYQSYVVSNENSLMLQNDKPAKAVLKSDGTAHLMKVYDIEPVDLKKRREKKKEAQKSDKMEYPLFGSHRVLLVGALHLSEYKDRLEKHGLTVILHHAFEENVRLLKNKYNKCDVCLVCTSHIPHSVLDHINKESVNVELIERDNEDTVAARVHYLISNISEKEGK